MISLFEHADNLFIFYIKLLKMNIFAVALATAQPAPGGRPMFSWDTVPVFFHSSNSSGQCPFT